MSAELQSKIGASCLERLFLMPAIAHCEQVGKRQMEALSPCTLNAKMV